MSQDAGDYFNAQGTIKNSLGISYTKCRAWRIDPNAKAPRPLIQEDMDQSNETRRASGLKAGAD